MFFIKEGPSNLSWTHILDWFRWGQESHTQFLWRKARGWGTATIFWQENGKSNPTVQEGQIWAELNKSLCVHTSFRCFALHRELSTSSVFRCSALHWCHSVLMYIFSHTYHSQLSPLSHSQSLCNSPGMLSKSLSSVQSPVRMWDSPLCFISTLRKQPWKRTYGTVRWSLPNDKTRDIIFSSRKLFFMFLGISFSRTFWSCVCTWTPRVTLSRGVGAVGELEGVIFIKAI